MDKQLSEKDRKRLLDALAQAKEMGRKMEEKMEKKRWTEIAVPLTLANSLAMLTKDDLSAIRSNLNIPGISALKKQELIDALVRQIPEALPGIFNIFDETRYRVTKQIADRGGHSYLPLESHQLAYFRDRGMIFSGTYKGKKVLAMPKEVLDCFEKWDSTTSRETVRRNTEWIKLTQGMLFYYGTLNLSELESLIQHHTGIIPGLKEYLSILDEAESFYQEIRYGTKGFSTIRVWDDKRVKQEHLSRPGLPFYPFTKTQLLQAGEPGFIDRTPSYRALVDYIRQNYTISQKEADSLVEECVYAIHIGESPNNLLEFLQSELVMDDLDTIQEFMDHIVMLHNNTKQWFTKGYSPNELSAARNKTTPVRPAANVVDFTTRKRVGRNDPCPCGSGRKFKKCCGG